MLVPQYQNLPSKNLSAFQKKSQIEKIYGWECGREGVSLYSVEKLLSHTTVKLCSRTIPCFRNFLFRKTIWIRGVFLDFQSKYVCLTVSKLLLEESFCVSEKFWYSGIMWIGRGEYQDFSSNYFCLTVTKTFVGNPSVFPKCSGIEKLNA